MTGNADVHEEARWSRLRNAKATDDAEEAAAAAEAQARRPARRKRIPGLCHKGWATRPNLTSNPRAGAE